MRLERAQSACGLTAVSPHNDRRTKARRGWITTGPDLARLVRGQSTGSGLGGWARSRRYWRPGPQARVPARDSYGCDAPARSATLMSVPIAHKPAGAWPRSADTDHARCRKEGSPMPTAGQENHSAASSVLLPGFGYQRIDVEERGR